LTKKCQQNTKKVENFKFLLRARIFGARQATGEVLVFLDSHIETNVEWVEPLLERIRQNRKVAATPIIDIIDADTFEYKSSPLVRGGFNWGLNFRWVYRVTNIT
jgi:polypeptide N-acetylgalactosaminyltransferase